MARNRKRRSDGRSRRPDAGPSAHPGVATASAARPEATGDPRREDEPRIDVHQQDQPGVDDESHGGAESLDAADPLAHAAPDVELAEAQLAAGRARVLAAPGDRVDDAELTAEAIEAGGGDRGGRRDVGAVGEGSPGRGSEAAPAALPARRPGNRLIGFVQGSWRELQRVQWPDRRQVMQATGVVIGFVIVAGVFLGVADLIAGRVVDLILK